LNKSKKPPEKRFYHCLIACCQYDFDPSQLGALEEYIDDWGDFLDSAYSHGVFPLVYQKLKQLDTLDERIKARMKKINFIIASNNITMTAELIRVVQLLRGQGIRSIAIKGPLLSQIIHGDITQRQFSDLDLLVEPSQMYSALELLSHHGYQSQYPIEFLKNKTLLKVGKDFPTTNTKNGVLIEFHWRLFLDRSIKKSTIDLFSPSNYWCTLQREKIETLQLDALLLYLLLHGSKHYWERLEWIVDVDRLIRLQKSTIDWGALYTMAEEMEIAFMFYLGLAVSHTLLHTPLEEIAHRRIASDPNILRSKEAIILELKSDAIKNEQKEHISMENLKKVFLLKDSRSGWLRHYLLTLFQIKELDVYRVNLPNFLSPLYYCVRMYRLFKENIIK
jgi:hypothetical protein